ncbi:Putative uncharacterized protein [Taphrina deformans PYCC 5710]|uniref:C2H2-type domain-containing protein n=1 Tax=Taphrina deformans (strain PYCC 5710 / ATCC 11124 / CBS 356.35 / IMI 108563 / JCM 9778 / NBRC 8474) TaxID=1097556 RepID=R4XAW5_TAPDE|nr:Putative uncharacterized protein [Taphrina deformans PYCC 5710]|eukprot:CCG82963.1 Putative uncharacterized protein [Taphrina deformans PYCC 5710]
MAPPVPLPFFCELCRKGYARISELEVHETSYDHHHRKRAADLRNANRDGARRERQAANDGVIRVLGAEEHTSKKFSGANSKRGFKSAFGAQDKSAASENVHAKSVKRQDAARGKTISELYGGSPRARREIDKHEASSSAASKSFIPSDNINTENEVDSKPLSPANTDKTHPSPPPPLPTPHRPTMVFKQEPQHDDYESSYFQPPSRTDKLEAEITGLSYMR